MAGKKKVTWKNVTSFACDVCPIEVRYMHMNLEVKVKERFIRKLSTPGMYVKNISTFNYFKHTYEDGYELFVETEMGRISLYSFPVNKQIEYMLKACKED